MKNAENVSGVKKAEQVILMTNEALREQNLEGFTENEITEMVGLVIDMIGNQTPHQLAGILRDSVKDVTAESVRGMLHAACATEELQAALAEIEGNEAFDYENAARGQIACQNLTAKVVESSKWFFENFYTSSPEEKVLHIREFVQSSRDNFTPDEKVLSENVYRMFKNPQAFTMQGWVLYATIGRNELLPA